jgi:hypothetical protein
MSRWLTLCAALVLLAGCGPSAAQLDCEAAGGTWESELSHYVPVWTGKSTVPIPIYDEFCEEPR